MGPFALNERKSGRPAAAADLLGRSAAGALDRIVHVYILAEHGMSINGGCRTSAEPVGCRNAHCPRP
jgi:hypothetical protein